MSDKRLNFHLSDKRLNMIRRHRALSHCFPVMSSHRSSLHFSSWAQLLEFVMIKFWVACIHGKWTGGLHYVWYLSEQHPWYLLKFHEQMPQRFDVFRQNFSGHHLQDFSFNFSKFPAVVSVCCRFYLLHIVEYDMQE